MMSFLFFSCKSDYILEWKILLRALGLLLSLDNAAPFCVFYSACSLTTPCCSAVVFVGCEDGQKADFFLQAEHLHGGSESRLFLYSVFLRVVGNMYSPGQHSGDSSRHLESSASSRPHLPFRAWAFPLYALLLRIQTS